MNFFRRSDGNRSFLKLAAAAYVLAVTALTLVAVITDGELYWFIIAYIGVPSSFFYPFFLAAIDNLLGLKFSAGHASGPLFSFFVVTGNLVVFAVIVQLLAGLRKKRSARNPNKKAERPP